MNRFSYARPTDVAEAVREVGSDPSARFIAGGTNLIDLMKYNVERPTRLVDITRLPLTTIDKADGGALRIGALVPNSDLAYDDAVTAKYPLLSGCDPGRRLAAASQHGVDRRQPAPADAVPVLL